MKKLMMMVAGAVARGFAAQAEIEPGNSVIRPIDGIAYSLDKGFMILKSKSAGK